MSQEIGPKMPPPLRFEFGVPPQAAGLARGIILATVDADGMPRLSILSMGEVRADSDQLLFIDVRKDTITARNLREYRPAALWCVLDGAAYTIRATATKRPTDDPTQEKFQLEVASVLRDFEQGAPMVAGPTYRLGV